MRSGALTSHSLTCFSGPSTPQDIAIEASKKRCFGLSGCEIALANEIQAALNLPQMVPKKWSSVIPLVCTASNILAAMSATCADNAPTLAST